MDLSFIMDSEDEKLRREAQREAWDKANPINKYCERYSQPEIVGDIDLPPGYQIVSRSYGFAVYATFDTERGGFPTDSKVGGYSLDEAEIANEDAWNHYHNRPTGAPGMA